MLAHLTAATFAHIAQLDGQISAEKARHTPTLPPDPNHPSPHHPNPNPNPNANPSPDPDPNSLN